MTERDEGLADEALWDAVDVSRYLKVSRSWVYHRAESGLLPHLRVGGLLRFEPDEIRRYAREGNQERLRARSLPLASPALRRSR